MKQPTIASRILDFYQLLSQPENLPEEVQVMNPYTDLSSWKIVETFYHTYYPDYERRIALFGINPGRFGGGITGIPFTDPIRLANPCGIENPYDQKAELSSKFIYDVIEAFGGPQPFYNKFYFTAISPLGFVSAGKNLNYYDMPEWRNIFDGYAARLIEQQLAFIDQSLAICIGQGENVKFFKHLNEKHHFFEEIRTVPHPRWVMQYRLKRKHEFIAEYIRQLTDPLEE